MMSEERLRELVKEELEKFWSEKLLPLLIPEYGQFKRAMQKDLASMPVINALIEIARDNGGMVVTKQAIGMLTKAGVFSTRGSANDNIHTTLRRSPSFRWERRGVYRLEDNRSGGIRNAQAHS